MLSPRKQVPLASGTPSDRPRARSYNSTDPSQSTKRAFFCSVVFEVADKDEPLHPDVQKIIKSLGTQLSADGKPVDYDNDNPFSTTPSPTAENGLKSSSTYELGSARPQSLADVIQELVKTERNYVQKLRVLKTSYADPLRSFARSKDTAIIPAYEANTLFGNIDTLLPANEAFLSDLERMLAPNGKRTVGGIGDVTKKHFQKLKTFDCYRQYYSKREEAQSIFRRELQRRSGFSAFIDRIQYSASDGSNGMDLRGLLMEPVQRMPRYTLLFETMLKYMDPSDPQRAKLIEAYEAGNKIALAETDDQTRRAAVMIGLGRSMEDFPPTLISNSRRFIDCIDVEDTMNTDPSSSSISFSSSSSPAVPCTLFLFDDRLLIAKRHSTSTPGRILAGLDDMERLAKGGVLTTAGMSAKKSMSSKGVVDITDLVATDPGGASLHLFLEKEPPDQSDRWSNRPFRSLTVVHPPASAAQAPGQVAEDKKRFLENLWTAQAMYRAKNGRSIAFAGKEVDVGTNKKTTARTWFNVYQRTAYLGEPKKTKIVLHIDPDGTADPIPFGVQSGPYIVVRVRPMRDDMSVYGISSCDNSDEGEEDIVRTSSISTRITQTIHQCGLFRFSTGNASRPTTPTASTRGRGAIFNLDAISRGLFNSRSGPTGSTMSHTRGISGSDYFGSGSGGGSSAGGSSSRKRTRSNSRGSTLISHSTGTTATSTTNDSMRFFSHRSNSTAATSIFDGGDSLGQKFRTSSSPMKFFTRHKSPERSPSRGSDSPSKAFTAELEFAAMSYDALSKEAEREADEDADEVEAMVGDDSALDLSLRLELARHNSLTQERAGTGERLFGRHLAPEESIVEDSEDSSTIRHAPSTIERVPSPSPSAMLYRPQSPDIPTRPTSALSVRRPMGPRDLARASSINASDIEVALERTLSQMDHGSSALTGAIPTTNASATFRPRTPSPPPTLPPLRLSPRKPVPLLEPEFVEPEEDTSATSIMPITPEPVEHRPPVEPLSIKKRSTEGPGSPVKELGRTLSSADRPDDELFSSMFAGASTSTPFRAASTSSKPLFGSNPTARVASLAEETWEDIERSQRQIKRIRLEVDDLDAGNRNVSRPASPTKRPLSIARAPVNAAAEARMEEMRLLIEKGRGTTPLRGASPSPFNGPSNGSGPSDVHHLKNLVNDAETDLQKAAHAHQALRDAIKFVEADSKDKEAELIRTRNELEHCKRQLDLVKQLLADATSENEIMYDAFNEELDGMFRDAELPQDEAWDAMVTDLRTTKDERNTLTKENKSLKRSLELAQLQNEQWGALLRAHGLIP